jgi:glycogen synthase
MSSEKIRIPDIKRLTIYNLPQNDASFKAFLAHCVPSSLQLLCLSSYPNLIKADDYLASLTSALQSTTKENYIRHFELSKEALEGVVKASANSHRLIVYNSKIDAEQEFDFGDGDYATSFLSFQS